MVLHQRVGKITLLSNDKNNNSAHEVSDYTFNQMSKEEQDHYLNTSISISTASQMGGVGSKMLNEMKCLVEIMEYKYNQKKPETLFEMKRRLLKQGLK